ncbi:hypothetical protein M433DRAFT_331725 [Acidomyces richmondensis BFW]|nr:hypothetical protein M433DRAFT_331725 [Acidomyces richmondensis BFW]
MRLAPFFRREAESRESRGPTAKTICAGELLGNTESRYQVTHGKRPRRSRACVWSGVERGGWWGGGLGFGAQSRGASSGTDFVLSSARKGEGYSQSSGQLHVRSRVWPKEKMSKQREFERSRELAVERRERDADLSLRKFSQVIAFPLTPLPSPLGRPPPIVICTVGRWRKPMQET